MLSKKQFVFPSLQVRKMGLEMVSWPCLRPQAGQEGAAVYTQEPLTTSYSCTQDGMTGQLLTGSHVPGLTYDVPTVGEDAG